MKEITAKTFERLAKSCGMSSRERASELRKILVKVPVGEEAELKVQRLKALADIQRLKILYLLKEREMCVCELMTVLKMSQPAISHHVKILKQAGFIKDERRGKWVFYRLTSRKVHNLLKTL